MPFKENSNINEIPIDNLSDKLDKLANNDLYSVMLPEIATTFNLLDKQKTIECTDRINKICSSDPWVIAKWWDFMKTLKNITI